MKNVLLAVSLADRKGFTMKAERYFFQTDQLQNLIECLGREGYQCIGPQVRDGAIIYDELQSVDQLPKGINDQQKPGSYSLTSDNTSKYFDWANGPQAIKPFFFSAKEPLWRCERSDEGKLFFTSSPLEFQPVAIIGARACDVAALILQDQHFLQQQFCEPHYQARRQRSCIIVVNCSKPASTCFCHSTGDGPFADHGYDISLTELDDGFLCEFQTESGQKILNFLELYKPTENQLLQEQSLYEHAIQQQRRLPDADIQHKLFEEVNSQVWEDIAQRCLSCGSCTSVCPSCFCHSESDIAELSGAFSTHTREWGSCFSHGHSYIHGNHIRKDTSLRYRQWLSHKFSSWYDQYGRSGCVGCGRCITWCPVGIDVTESLSELCGEKR